MKQSCENCRFFSLDSYVKTHGNCCRYPPRALEVHFNGDTVTVFPEVYHGEWCGEWQERHGIQAAQTED